LKKKIAFVVQRYGLEVNGGAEYHCRILAEHLKDNYDITVLTSCAKNYLTWADEYHEGETTINDIKVQRFASNTVRNWKKFRSLSRKLKKRKPYQKALRFLGLLNFYERLIPVNITEDDNNNWVKLQGPYIPGLINYLKENHQNYNALIFFTYLYYPTIYGIKVAPEKSILIPTAHDEPPIYFPLFKPFFKMPKAIMYNTKSEKNFVTNLFNNGCISNDIVGVGISAPQPLIDYNVIELLKTNAPYYIYIGRIDGGKGCQVMFDYFMEYVRNTAADLKLVLVGQSFMKIPQHPSIIEMGFVDEDIKISLLKKAKALVMPSFYESLSMVTLESMAYGIPVIANQDCEVLKDHIANSKAGFVYKDYNTFKIASDKCKKIRCRKLYMEYCY
jgi:glycosyltransferase involved in cell wall biosynthesis